MRSSCRTNTDDKFGAGQNSPLEPSKLLYPLIIFSHGLAGTRHTYTQYVTALASQGYVVLVLEHRDGSAPAVSLPPLSESLDGHDGSAAAGCKDKERILHYLKLPDLAWDDEEDKSLMRFRTLQLDMRVRETYEAYHSFKRLTNGDHESVTVIDGLKKVDEAALLSSFRDKVNIDSVTLTGHSFGAGTLVSLVPQAPTFQLTMIKQLHLLQIPSPDTTLPAIPINRVICLDPWLEPLPTPTPASPEPSITVPPVLAINAPGFTVWEDHFVQCVDIVQKLNGSLVTLLGANRRYRVVSRSLHRRVILMGDTDQSFSDFPLFAPSNPTPALDLLTTIHDLSMAFMNGNLTSAKGIEGKKADNGAYDGREQRKMVGRKGDVIVHVLGTQS